ncbi:urease accessory protein UreE [Actibacterium sp.]|uniref:urease accessory protein UreE n=1 Tax=Actibacterium sp. TaxID=1872125 RepID=UPI003565AB4E
MVAVLCSYKVARQGQWSDAADTLTLSYEARFLRRKRLTTDSGADMRVDLPETTSLAAGDALILEDGRAVAIQAAPETLLKITGPNLPRLAWHIGNRHTPCQIEADHLLIAHDHVLADMLAHLGAGVAHVTAPFTPEGGAYGHGRTMGHSHGDHDHGHDHSHDHTHDHSHSHDH